MKKKINQIFNGTTQAIHPPFYAKTVITPLHDTVNKTALLSKFASYPVHHVNTIRVGMLYKPVSRMLNPDHDGS